MNDKPNDQIDLRLCEKILNEILELREARLEAAAKVIRAKRLYDTATRVYLHRQDIFKAEVSGYEKLDRRLAFLDGRYRRICVVAEAKPKKQKTRAETARTAVAKLSDEQKQALLAELLK